MSRVGLLPIPLPSGVQITNEAGLTVVKGPKGSLSRRLHPDIAIQIEGDKALCVRPTDRKDHRSIHGLTRSLLANMVTGVSQGYERRLQVMGVGYRAELVPDGLQLSVGYSHPVVMKPMEGISFEVGLDTNTRSPFIVVRGIDKETVGEQCALIRGVRPPEPYKGKGIRYAGEHVRRKAGKAGKAAGK